jgi:hypothetical protein
MLPSGKLTLVLKITTFNEIHYFYGHVQSRTVRLPEGIYINQVRAIINEGLMGPPGKLSGWVVNLAIAGYP